MILQLNPPLQIETPKGDALAMFVVDYGADWSLIWVAVIDATGECWSFQNPEIKFPKNITTGRRVA